MPDISVRPGAHMDSLEAHILKPVVCCGWQPWRFQWGDILGATTVKILMHLSGQWVAHYFLQPWPIQCGLLAMNWVLSEINCTASTVCLWLHNCKRNRVDCRATFDPLAVNFFLFYSEFWQLYKDGKHMLQRKEAWTSGRWMQRSARGRRIEILNYTIIHSTSTRA